MHSVANLATLQTPLAIFSPKKAPKPYLVSENRPVLPPEREVLLSQRAHTHLSLSLALYVCSVSVQRTAEKSSALIQLNTYIILLASLILHDASIAEITAQLLSLSYVYLIS